MSEEFNKAWSNFTNVMATELGIYKFLDFTVKVLNNFKRRKYFMSTIKNNFLSKLEKDLFDLKKEILKNNNKIKDINTLIWMLDRMRNLIGEEMLKKLSTVPETPWDEIYEKTEYIWTYCYSCGWHGFVEKPKRDEPCPKCNVFDLKQRFVIVKIHCNKCGNIHYAAQGKLKCIECGSEYVSIIQKMEVLRTVTGRFDFDEKIKPAGFKPWPKDEKGNLVF